MLPWMTLVVAALTPDKKHIGAMILVMAFTTVVLDRSYWSEVSGRDYSTYTEDLRNDAGGGPMGFAGSNGLAAYEAQFTTFLIAFAAYERRRWLRLGYLALIIASVACLAYSLSRGGYAAIIVGALFIGIVNQRKLLFLLMIVLLTSTAWAPQAVRDRVMMTQQETGFDQSAETRLTLWDDAMQLFRDNPLFGTGFNTYAYMHRIREYQDTHNYYLKVLVETGVIGLLLFLGLLWKLFSAGFGLYRRSSDGLLAAVGLGLAGWVVAAAVANCFGDRWNYPQVSGYMWIIAGLVSHGCRLNESESQTEEADIEEDDAQTKGPSAVTSAVFSGLQTSFPPTAAPVAHCATAT